MDVRKILEESGAFLKGHFLLSSGLHSDSYIQCAKALVYPENAQILADRIYTLTVHLDPDLIISPALGGIIIGWEVAKRFKLPFIFSERERGLMTLRRGFEIKKGERVMIVEDVFTTGKSTLETAEVVKKNGGVVVGACAIVERGDVVLDFPHYYLIKISLLTYSSSNCPLCSKKIPLVKPGSKEYLNDTEA
ncbi:MAG: orotate phosphoribosyltransferase [Elusimicrobiales bacterium]